MWEKGRCTSCNRSFRAKRPSTDLTSPVPPARPASPGAAALAARTAMGQTQAELLADLEHAKAMRLFDLIKPPFADNAGGDPQKKKRRISGMHADGKARVVTSGELKASIEEAERPALR